MFCGKEVDIQYKPSYRSSHQIAIFEGRDVYIGSEPR